MATLAVLYAAKAGFFSQGFSIINCSWGGIGYNLFEQATINTVYNNYNAVIFAAAGNGSATGWGEDYSSHYPSSYENVISVTALGQNGAWNHWATYHESIDLASPGEGIRSTRIGNGYTSWSGSSMATPIVGSVMGLMKSVNPNWNNERLITMVLGTSDPIIYSINSENYLEGKLGQGRVDALKAVTTSLFPKIEFIDVDLNIIDDLLDAQWIIMWYWINHTILDRNTYDDFQIKKGIKLSFSIIKPQLTSIGKVAFDRTLQTL